MTEAERLACTDPSAMLEWLRNSGMVDRRKLGFFFAACCRRIQLLRVKAKNWETEFTDWNDNAIS